MAVTYSDFILVFPEFSNATTYPVAGIDVWIALGYSTLNNCNFNAPLSVASVPDNTTQLDLAVLLFTAHNAVLNAQAAATAATPSGIVGQVVAPLSSKSVGPVSASYDVAAVTSDNAGIYNATSYGQRLWKMFLTFNSGPFYVAPPRRYGWGIGGPRGYPGGFGGFGP